MYLNDLDNFFFEIHVCARNCLHFATLNDFSLKHLGSLRIIPKRKNFSQHSSAHSLSHPICVSPLLPHCPPSYLAPQPGECNTTAICYSVTHAPYICAISMGWWVGYCRYLWWLTTANIEWIPRYQAPLLSAALPIFILAIQTFELSLRR